MTDEDHDFIGLAYDLVEAVLLAVAVRLNISVCSEAHDLVACSLFSWVPSTK